MREPAFWWQPGRGRLLSPLAAVYGAAAKLRMQKDGQHAGVPVICLGNLTLGGAGKTPAALAVARLLVDAQHRPFFLSRGYGGRLAGPVQVDPSVHRAADVGDEPLLLGRVTATIVSRDRVAGAAAARNGGATVIVMDDGLQNPSLHKDLAIVVVDGRRGIGNGRVFPAGPLRAPLEFQIARAHALVVVGPADGTPPLIDMARHHGVALFHGRLEADNAAVVAIGRQKVLAFAGIADPEKFFATLAEAGIAVEHRARFDDHHYYTAAEAQDLVGRADAANLALITTEKDHVRLAGDPRLTALAARSLVLPVRLVVEEDDAFRRMVLNVANPA